MKNSEYSRVKYNETAKHSKNSMFCTFITPDLPVVFEEYAEDCWIEVAHDDERQWWWYLTYGIPKPR